MHIKIPAEQPSGYSIAETTNNVAYDEKAEIRRLQAEADERAEELRQMCERGRYKSSPEEIVFIVLFCAAVVGAIVLMVFDLAGAW